MFYIGYYFGSPMALVWKFVIFSYSMKIWYSGNWTDPLHCVFVQGHADWTHYIFVLVDNRLIGMADQIKSATTKNNI
jgi:hypothetical protein